MAYNLDQITIVDVVKNGDIIRINFRPMLETLYFCPGVNINKTSDSIELSFVRCNINSDCPVQLKAKHADKGIDFIELEDSGIPIYMIYDDGKKQLFPI